jgi:prepilin-type processing-associated H-X9-DG protein
MHAYHQAHDTLPWNAIYANSPGDKAIHYLGPSWMSLILPFVEQQPLYDQIRFGQYYDWISNGQQPNILAAQTVVPAFRCPSDDTCPNGRLVGPYAGPRGLEVCDWEINQIHAAITNYKACAGANWGSPWEYKTTYGPNAGNENGLDYGTGIAWRNWIAFSSSATMKGPFPPVAFHDITDGLSRTFAIGEAIANRNAFNGWRNTDGCTATCGIRLNSPVPNDPSPYSDDAMDNYSFSSQHPGGSNFGMCDGSVIFVSDTIEFQTVYHGLATIAGQEAVDLP